MLMVMDPMPKARRKDTFNGVWHCVELSSVDYSEAHRLQLDLVTARHAGTLSQNVVLFLEHHPVFTLGRRGGLDNLRVSREFLLKRGVPIVQAERGGDITYHGPGQLVVYPIVDLDKAGLGVPDYVHNLEEVMIRTAADFGIKAQRNKINRGVWVVDRKLGSIGITIRGGISFHGFALNVNTDLAPFDWVNPCGLHGTHMTSMAQERKQAMAMDRVRESAKGHLKNIFGAELSAKTEHQLVRLLQT
jgi:lipoate-protein ligase B